MYAFPLPAEPAWSVCVQGNLIGGLSPTPRSANFTVTGIATYEYHSEKEDYDLQPGQNVTLNWGVSQFIPLSSDQHLLLEIGPAGWNGWQLSADEGSDAIGDEKDRTYAAGGQLGVTYLPWFLAVNFHGFYEYETRSRFQGYSLGLSIAKKIF